MNQLERDYYVDEARRRNWAVLTEGACLLYQHPLAPHPMPLDALPYDLGYMALTTESGTVFLADRDFIYVGVECSRSGQVFYSVNALLMRGKHAHCVLLSPCSHRLHAAILRDGIRYGLAKGKRAMDARRLLSMIEIPRWCRKASRPKAMEVL